MACEGDCYKVYEFRPKRPDPATNDKGTVLTPSGGNTPAWKPAKDPTDPTSADYKVFCEMLAKMAQALYDYKDDTSSKCAGGCDCVPLVDKDGKPQPTYTAWLEVTLKEASKKTGVLKPGLTKDTGVKTDYYSYTLDGEFYVRTVVEKTCVQANDLAAPAKKPPELPKN